MDLSSAKIHTRLVALIALFVWLDIHGQNTWWSVYGAYGDDRCRKVKVINDDLIIAAGSTGSFGEGSSDIYLVAADGNGAPIWSTTIGGVHLEQITSMEVCANGDLLLCGSFNGATGEGYQGLLIRTTPTGDVIWQRTYGGSDWDFFNDGVELADGGYLIVGETYSYGGPAGSAWILRLDALGDTLWTRAESVPGGQVAYAVDVTQDGGFVICGSRTSSFGDRNAWVCKLDGGGEMIWEESYGGAGEEIAYDVIATIDGGYAFVGSTGSYTQYLRSYHMKLNSDGGIEWERNWGGSDDQEGYELFQTPSSEYILAGYVKLGAGGGKDMYIQKSWIDGDFVFGRSYGGVEEDIGYSAASIEDGYVLAGITGSYGSGGSDVFLVRTDLDGNTVDQDVTSHFDPLSIYDPDVRTNIFLFPNPSTGSFRFQGFEPVAVRVLDMRGREVERTSLVNGAGEWSSTAVPGSYVVEAIDRTGARRYGRLLLARP